MHYSNSSSKQTTGAKLTWKNSQLAMNAFKECSDVIAANLDVSEMFPQLNSKGLLTDEDCQILLNNYISDVKKIHYLLYVLPRKEKFFDNFMYCLDKTIEGTGHGIIAKELSASYEEEVRKGNPVDMPSAYTSANKVCVLCKTTHNYNYV